MEGKFDRIYMNYPYNKHNEWAEEIHRKREDYKKGRYHRKRDCENSNGNIGIGKILILSSQMQFSWCTERGISQDDITKMIGLYN